MKKFLISVKIDQLIKKKHGFSNNRYTGTMITPKEAAPIYWQKNGKIRIAAG